MKTAARKSGAVRAMAVEMPNIETKQIVITGTASRTAHVM
jgi:hypothetical protein